jgi:hypothetical protein
VNWFGNRAPYYKAYKTKVATAANVLTVETRPQPKRARHA